LTALDMVQRDFATAVITFHEAVARRLGMSAAEHKVLGVLSEIGVATPGQLAAAAGLTTGAITGIVDRLEAAGHAKREPNPADRRSLLIRALPSPERLQVIGPIFQSLTEAMAELRSRYSAEELGVVQRYLAETVDILKRESAKLGAKTG
jgi:DNA-binding MarR family transcriptional regulator